MKHIPYVILSSFFFVTVCMLGAKHVHAQDLPLVSINEIHISGGTGHTNDDFIELYNTTDAPIDITDWQLRKKTKTDTTSTGGSLKSFSTPTDTIIIIPARGYFLWTNSTGAFKSLTDTQFVNASTIADDNSVALFDTNNTLIDAVTWGTGHTLPFLPSKLYPLNPPANTSTERDFFTNTFVTQTHPTPQNTAYMQNKPTPPLVIAPDNTTIATTTVSSIEKSIHINEILPNPSDTEEFIELFNFGATPLNLKDWSLHDASKTGRYTFKEDTIINPQSHLTLMRSTFSFALNNTNETITLLDAQGVLVDTIAYLKSTKDVSYNNSTSGWHWSTIITPNATNQLIDIPVTKTTIPKKVYIATPADFIAKTPDDTETKYLWDFGDKHTSRLAHATHTYTKKGTYTVTLTTFGSIEETTQTFTVHVKKPPTFTLAITEVNPNPTGIDTGSEYIIVKNTSAKKVDLLHWIIATGTQKARLTNHPITHSFTLKSQEERIIKNDIASFSLPNKEGFIEIRQPNKKAIDAVHYSKNTSIAENERYQKSPETGWIWIQNDGTKDTSEQLTGEQTVIQTTSDTKTLTLENLSIEELSLLKTHIDELILTASKKEVSVKTDILKQNTTASAASPITSQQDTLKDLREKPTFSAKTCENKNISLEPYHTSLQTLLSSTRGTSPLNQELSGHTIQDKTLIQHINQTLYAVWKK